jgi:hypothetical protein
VSDQLLTFFFVGMIAELAILMFMAFRRARGSCLLQLIIAFFAFFTALMALLAFAGSIEKSIAFTDGSEVMFPGAFAVLGALIVVIWKGSPRPVAAPRKRPLILDMLGCAGLGILGLFAFVMGIGALTLLAR